MNVLVAYDVGTTDEPGKRRLQRVAKICEGYGQRVQYSVFEVSCSRADYLRLLSALRSAMKEDEDSLRIYHFDRNGFDDVVRIGRQLSFGPRDAWTV
ncbi:MAG: CRISPR-associated endonuclease Cas2 [Propionicimonas sp.]|uniref:CRISPR-associated endonuclease Cas2 n=1 Tax=Propionicimonas sp. TaxID=1955623 RepID=UPI003D11A3F2